MKSQLLASRWCLCPSPKAAAADKFIAFFFENGPVLNAVFIKTRHFGSHFFSHSFITERSSEESHNIRIPPKASRQTKIVFFPNAKEESVSTENFHRKKLYTVPVASA